MEAHFITQPYTYSLDARTVLNEALASGDYHRFDMACAWVRRSGLNLISEALSGFRAAGGTARIITGVSMEGATWQGLQAARELFDQSCLFHHPGRVFHPKLYTLVGDTKALILSGSFNGTVGGLVENWELGTALTLDLAVPQDMSVLKQVDIYYDRLLSDQPACQPLTAILIDALKANGSFGIVDEGASRPAGLPPGALESPFGGGSQERLNRARRRSGTPANTSGASMADGGAGAPVDGSTNATVRFRWSKTLRPADAQRLVGSNPTGTVTLVQGHARGRIRHETWFRQELFGMADWRLHSSGKYEYANLSFDVTAYGENLGDYTLQVRQTPRFDSKQHNRTASLHWGRLSGLTKERNLTGATLTLENLSDDSYRLYVGSDRVGDLLT